ncbi:MAG TPA: MEDS domain-containing protein [Candidatus Thermoplasmatota archaeon]|nr:MEDS domain-containing protein [Candidatus Thermoplasmatota archaeon]
MPLNTLEGRSDVRPHMHAVNVYRDGDGLLRAITRFIDDGIAAGDVMVFVHAFRDDEEAWAFLDRARPGARTLAEDRLVLVSFYQTAFERDGSIDVEHVARTVSTLIDAAVEEGRSGLRLFVDASRTYFDSDRVDEWFEFEAWLGRRLDSEAGLVCAYREPDLRDPDVVARVLETHGYRFEPEPRQPSTTRWHDRAV